MTGHVRTVRKFLTDQVTDEEHNRQSDAFYSLLFYITNFVKAFRTYWSSAVPSWAG